MSDEYVEWCPLSSKRVQDFQACRRQQYPVKFFADGLRQEDQDVGIRFGRKIVQRV